MYLHPWELDPGQPRMDGSWFSRFRHYNNLDKTESRLVSLLNDFRFAPIREAIEPLAQLTAVPTVNAESFSALPH
jgi:hypothetical protein